VRAPVDVVMPYGGPEDGLPALLRRLALLRRAPGDTVTLVHNRPGRRPPPAGVLRATGQRSSYHARNRGAGRGENPWLLFLDADVDPDPDILDAYLATEPGPRVGLLVGGLRDEAPIGASRPPLAARYAYRQGHMSTATVSLPRTANLLVRRAAWAEAGGFAEGIRSGGDVDLGLRLRALGWTSEPREAAGAVHRSRTSLGALAAQVVRHGTGCAWVEARHPGTFPRRRKPGLAWWSARGLARAARAAASGAGEDAAIGALEALLVWADELGRLIPNRARS
jgi:mycofactocin glycosyltransferase